MAAIRFFIVDAFTDTAFKGNPAGVCLLPEDMDTSWMQNVATELNLSETAFLLGSDNEFSLRWFTPAVEVDLCGHATLAASHVLVNDLAFDSDACGPIRYETRSGIITTRADADGTIVMDFPAGKIGAKLGADQATELATLELFSGDSPRYLLGRLADEAAVAGYQPDIDAILSTGAVGLVVTAASTRPGVDFVSRMFAPAVGIAEDPVTGSAHCLLAPFWASRSGRSDLVGEQLSARGGRVRATLISNRVKLAGRAVTVASGILRQR